MGVFSPGTYRVLSPGTDECVAKIVVSDTGLQVVEEPGAAIPPDHEIAEFRAEILSFNRATEILRRDRTKCSPGFLDGRGSIFHPYETVQLMAGRLLLRAERLEVLPPTTDVLITHAVRVTVLLDMQPLAHLMIAGYLPFDGSEVQKQLVLHNEGQPVIVPEV